MLISNPFLSMAQRYDRGGEEYGPPMTIGYLIFLVVIVLIILFVKSGNDLKRRKEAYQRKEIGENSLIKFGRYAIKKEIRLEYPVAYIKDKILIFISQDEADRTGEILNHIRIPISNIESIDITKTIDKYANHTQIGFTGSLTVKEKNDEFTELVFNDKAESEIKRFTILKERLIERIKNSL